MNKLLELYYKNNSQKDQSLIIDLTKLSRISNVSEYFTIQTYVDDYLISTITNNAVLSSLNSFVYTIENKIPSNSELILEINTISNEYIVHMFDFGNFNIVEFSKNYEINIKNMLNLDKFVVNYIRPQSLVVNVSDLILINYLSKSLDIQ